MNAIHSEFKNINQIAKYLGIVLHYLHYWIVLRPILEMGHHVCCLMNVLSLFNKSRVLMASFTSSARAHLGWNCGIMSRGLRLHICK